MGPALALVLALLGGGALAWLARREHRAVAAARAALLDDCRAVLDTARLTLAPDGFPRLDGTIGSRAVRLELIPDSLTLRRLPQLWLAVTISTRRVPRPAFALLTRATGAEFFAATHRLALRLDPPAGLPAEILARGAARRAQALLDRAGAPLRALFADPRIKEVAALPGALRVVRQAAEGRRGDYLLLRQCVFGDTPVAAATLLALHDALVGLEDALAAEPAPTDKDEVRP
ncbi:hypothetical protein [Labrys wisconsinensis]|uniref:Uncharacterized protein n=1 Tax=Labrys wisconsinensis TaxID=425677 RepID=A0ABU0JJA2_9HYPH|nr:hypothetical protein [Labrys wisconsinensis]MDQ0473488.1 hypothetical protein [Labrys wisconsinensis]